MISNGNQGTYSTLYHCRAEDIRERYNDITEDLYLLQEATRSIMDSAATSNDIDNSDHSDTVTDNGESNFFDVADDVLSDASLTVYQKNVLLMALETNVNGCLQAALLESFLNAYSQ